MAARARGRWPRQDVAEEEGGYGTTGGEAFERRRRLREVVLQQLEAAGHGSVLDREEAPTLGKHVRYAVLNEKIEI